LCGLCGIGATLKVSPDTKLPFKQASLAQQKRPTKRSQDTDSVLSGKMMACQLDVVHWTLGILRHFQAFF
jgi:hypothetical protein